MTPHLHDPLLDPHWLKKGGSKKMFFFGPSFEGSFGPSWPPLASTRPQKDPKMAPKRVPKEGPAEHVKSFVFDGRYFKIAPGRGRKWGHFAIVSRSPFQNLFVDHLGGSWESFGVAFGLQRGPQRVPKLTTKRPSVLLTIAIKAPPRRNIINQMVSKLSSGSC